MFLHPLLRRDDLGYMTYRHDLQDTWGYQTSPSGHTSLRSVIRAECW